MAFQGINMAQAGQVGAGITAQDSPKWRCEYMLEKRWVIGDGEKNAGDYEVIHGIGNVLTNIGANVIWERLITAAASTSSTGATMQSFSTGNAVIGISTDNTAAAAAQTDLQGSTKWYLGMSASSYPAHSTAASTAARSCAFRCVATTSEANIAWNEWGIFNSSAGAMLNRKVQSLGTKTSAAQWTFTCTLTLS